MASHRVRRFAIPPAWVGLVVAVATGCIGVALLVPIFATPTAQPAAAMPQAISDSSVVVPTSGAAAARLPGPPAAPVAGQPLELSIPSIGLHARVGSMRVAAGGTVDPPTPSRAYWLRNYGVAGPASDNTVYIAGHTFHGGGTAVFNPLLDIPNSTTTVKAGDEIVIRTSSASYTYDVTSTELYAKNSITQQAELWKRVPGRLVLITCFQYKGGTSSQQNYVVYAQLVRA
jgi:hypothetical protein